MKIKESTIIKARERFYAKTNGLELLTDFSGWDNDVTIRCTECGFVFDRIYNLVKSQRGIHCPQCRKNELKARQLQREAEERRVREEQFAIDEEERRAKVVRDRCKGFEYAGNYTGSDGTADIRCTVCGTITTRSWCSIKQGKPICRTCEDIERKRKQTEKKRQTVRAEFIRKANIKQKQATFRECAECGCLFVSYRSADRYCSPACATKHGNRVGKDRRLKRIDHTGADMSIDWKPLYKREHGICYLCGKPVDVDDYEWRDGTFIAGNLYPSVDHVVALHDGGTHTWDNVRLAHRLCNTLKH